MDLIITTPEELSRIVKEAVKEELRQIQKESEPLSDFPEILNRNQVGEIFGKTPKTIDVWSKPGGKLKRYYNGSTPYYFKKEILSLLKK